MSQKKKIKELEEKVDQIMEYIENNSQPTSSSPEGKN